MPKSIITQDEKIIKYVNELNLPYSSSLQNHMVNMISGIILTEGNKNVSSIYNKVTCNRHRSSGSRFLSEYSWNNEYVDEQRINHTMKHIRRNVDKKAVGFLIIDDTLSKKDPSTKHIEALDFHNSHADGNKSMWSHCVVTSNYSISDYSLPLSFKLYLRKEFLGKRAKKLFKNKQELATLLIDEFAPVTEINYLLIDAWYTSGKVMLHALLKGYHTIGRLKSNRVIYPAGLKTNLKKFASFVEPGETHPVTVGDSTYYVYRYEEKINDLENTVILLSWSEKDLSDKPSFIISTDITLEDSTILSYYQKRWDIEVSYRYKKNSLGFDEFQVESLKSITRFWSMVYMTYTFLELFRVENKRKLKFSTLGDVLGYFRNKYLVQIIKFVYSCAQNNMDINDTLSMIGMVA